MRKRRVFVSDKQTADVLRRTASNDQAEMETACREMAQSISQRMNKVLFGIEPEKDEQGAVIYDESNGVQYQEALTVDNQEVIQAPIYPGDIISDIFTVDFYGGDAFPMYPLHFVAPGTEAEYVAYAIPTHGAIPERKIEGDEVTLSTYRVANAINWNIKYSQMASINVLSEAMDTLRMGFTKRFNDDGWHTLLQAAKDRGLLIFDSAASNGQVTLVLIGLMKLAMRRNAGGNSASVNRFRMTDLYLSPEGIEDIRALTPAVIGEEAKGRVLVSPDEVVRSIYEVNLIDLDEFGQGQEYQKYYTDILSGSMNGSDNEIVVGIDLTHRSSYVMPVKEEVSLFPDPQMHRRQEIGFYGWAEIGMAVLDNRGLLIGSA